MANESNFKLRIKEKDELIDIEPSSGQPLYSFTRDTGTKIKITKPKVSYDNNSFPYINYYKNLDDKDPTYVYSIRSIKKNSDGRKLYKLAVYDKSTTRIHAIWYYTSRSEGGFLRLCVKRTDGNYDKGYDYVSTTFVNIYLQESIFRIEKYYIVANEEFLPSECPDNAVDYYELPKGRFTSQPNYNDELFDFLSRYLPHAGDMFLSKEDYDKKIKDITDISRSSSSYNTIAKDLLKYIPSWETTMIEKNDRMTMARTGEVRTRGRRNLMSLRTGTVLVLSAVASFASPVLAQEINPVDEISNPQANEFQRVVMAIEDFDTPFVRDGVLRERETFVPVERAMTKEQVRQLVGEPVRMENSLADKWVYQIRKILF